MPSAGSTVDWIRASRRSMLLRGRVQLDNGSRWTSARSCIATGADPVQLPIPGAKRMRSPLSAHRSPTAAPSSERAQSAKHVVVVGASFIGLEVAASLRARGIAVDVVAPENVPLERVHGRRGRPLRSRGFTRRTASSFISAEPSPHRRANR